ncbi:MAG: hypothetical protein MSS78_08780, partial [Bacteroidales bacterium]|nr:hypothetical protein [Bacteroidales bacterium]
SQGKAARLGAERPIERSKYPQYTTLAQRAKKYFRPLAKFIRISPDSQYATKDTYRSTQGFTPYPIKQ